MVSKINNDKNNIELKVFLNFSRIIEKKSGKQDEIVNIHNFHNIATKSLEFKRGYNTTGAKRYTVKYLVMIYICV